MIINATGKLLSAIAKPYSFKDDKGAQREGVSNKVRFNIEGEIFEFKVTAEQVASLQSRVNQEIELEIGLTSPKELLTAKLVSFE
ncbi:MAG TPA: hypothetical protein VMR41_06305 [Patescibacteria group bacterium]|nr:hypothetical protein [Patescibacteria group bacterium]